jgi:predicted acetyltransferase
MKGEVDFPQQHETLTDGTVRLKLVSNYDNQLMYEIYETDGSEIIGYCDLRIGHSPYLYYYGNIGYRIKPDYQGHNYALKAVMLLLNVARDYHQQYLLLTVSPDNPASERTIEKSGAQYLKTVRVPLWHPLYHSERIKKIYRIDL